MLVVNRSYRELTGLQPVELTDISVPVDVNVNLNYCPLTPVPVDVNVNLNSQQAKLAKHE